MKTTDKETTHTPTPWKTIRMFEDGIQITKKQIELFQGEADPYFIADCGSHEESKTNAEFIVRAVNSHEALIDAVNGLLAIVKDDLPQLGNDLIRQENTIIRKAENLLTKLEVK